MTETELYKLASYLNASVESVHAIINHPESSSTKTIATVQRAMDHLGIKY